MWSDLTLGPSFKVKLWFTGFELSFWWIQICIDSLKCMPSVHNALQTKLTQLWNACSSSSIDKMHDIYYLPSAAEGRCREIIKRLPDICPSVSHVFA